MNGVTSLVIFFIWLIPVQAIDPGIYHEA